MVIKNIIMSLLLSLLVAGCFFSVKEMVVDPDKGLTHSEVKENGIQAKR